MPLDEAERTLADIAEAVGAGETIVVTKDGVPVFDIVSHQGAAEAAPVLEPRKGGLNFKALEDYQKKHGIDQIVTWIADDFDAPISEEEFLEIFEPGQRGCYSTHTYHAVCIGGAARRLRQGHRGRSPVRAA